MSASDFFDGIRDGERIATGGLRTGNDIVFYGGAVCGGTHGCRPTRYFCRAGPVCPAGECGKTWFGPMHTSAPTDGLQGVR